MIPDHECLSVNFWTSLLYNNINDLHKIHKSSLVKLTTFSHVDLWAK